MENRVDFFNGTLDEVDGKLVQVGHKCKRCGRMSFPRTEGCVYCGSGDYEDQPVLTEGTLYSFSVCMRPVGPYEPPIIGGFVNFEDGTRIYGQIHCDASQVKRGMKLKAETGVLYTKEDGTDVYGYWYVPAEGGAK